MRDLAVRTSRFKPLQTFLYLHSSSLSPTCSAIPLEYYESFAREHKYGLATQTFGPWMGDEGKALLVNLVLGGLAAVALFAIVRKLSKTWWIWGSQLWPWSSRWLLSPSAPSTCSPSSTK
jgi:STE24 endopeptidase